MSAGALPSRSLLRDALALDAVDARTAGAIGYMARILVQATLPHRRPSWHEFERANGRYSLHLHAPPSIGLPYGSYPRLVLAWLNTEAVVLNQQYISMQQIQRRLLTPDEAMRLPDDDALVFVAGHPPIRATKIRYFTDHVLAHRASLPPPLPSDLVASGALVPWAQNCGHLPGAGHLPSISSD